MKSINRSDPPFAINVGCGQAPLAGWTNVDIVAYAGVDRVLDVVRDFPFRDVDYIFAEHFIEHLSLPDAITFLRHCHASLAEDGVIRLSTPNLDWVWLTHYAAPEGRNEGDSLQGCLEINRAFRGWGHQFVYNREMLSRMLRYAGFTGIEPAGYGQSAHPFLNGIERHERGQDHPQASHIVILEARRGKSHDPASTAFDELIEPYLRDFGVR